MRFLYLLLHKIIQIIKANSEEGNVIMEMQPKIGALMELLMILSKRKPMYPLFPSLFRLIEMNELINNPNEFVNISVARYKNNSTQLNTASILSVDL